MLSADGIPFDYILDVFTHCPEVDITTFYFSGEEPGDQHYLGYLPQYEDSPYWAEYCDLKNGFVKPTAKELFHAPYYGGKSLAERWEEIHFNTIGKLPPECFIKGNEDAFPISLYFTAADRGQLWEELDSMKYEKVLDMYHHLCQNAGEEIAQKLASEAIRYFRSFKQDSNMMLSSPDAGLKNLWDEICVQVQTEYGILWYAHEDFMEQYLEDLIRKRCNMSQRKLLWLCTEKAEGWNCSVSFMDIDKLLDGDFAAEADIADTVNYLKTVVLREADKYTNKQIREYVNESFVF